jgi:hypothetical protein
MKSKAGYIKAITLAILVAAGTIWSARQVSGFTVIERGINFANISLSRGQSVRLHVANAGDSPIAFHWGVLNDSGKNLLPAIQSTLEAGHSTFIDLNADQLTDLEGRTQVRAVVKVSSLDKSTAGATLASFELFDNQTGAIIAILNPAN